MLLYRRCLMCVCVANECSAAWGWSSVRSCDASNWITTHWPRKTICACFVSCQGWRTSHCTTTPRWATIAWPSSRTPCMASLCAVSLFTHRCFCERFLVGTNRAPGLITLDNKRVSLNERIAAGNVLLVFLDLACFDVSLCLVVVCCSQ